jgi:uncharacterized protein YndB with AHSA1/START domain
MTTKAEDFGQASVTINRLIDAPVTLMWKVWTEPEHLAAWWGPQGFTNTDCSVDLKVGGELRITMVGPDGARYPTEATFEDIVPNQRLVMALAAVSPEGVLQLRSQTTVTMRDEGGKTRLIVQADARGFIPEAVQMLAGMEMGWSQSLDKLAGFVASL